MPTNFRTVQGHSRLGVEDRYSSGILLKGDECRYVYVGISNLEKVLSSYLTHGIQAGLFGPRGEFFLDLSSVDHFPEPNFTEQRPSKGRRRCAQKLSAWIEAARSSGRFRS